MSTNTLELGSIASLTHSRYGVASPEQQAPKPSKKPAVGRRNISLYIPYKGQEFSVDDAEDSDLFGSEWSGFEARSTPSTRYLI